MILYNRLNFEDAQEQSEYRMERERASRSISLLPGEWKKHTDSYSICLPGYGEELCADTSCSYLSHFIQTRFNLVPRPWLYDAVKIF